MPDQTKGTPYTLPRLLRHHTEKYGDRKIALREKDRGIWKPYTWADYYSIVRRLACAFIELGLQPRWTPPNLWYPKDSKLSLP